MSLCRIPVHQSKLYIVYAGRLASQYKVHKMQWKDMNLHRVCVRVNFSFLASRTYDQRTIVWSVVMSQDITVGHQCSGIAADTCSWAEASSYQLGLLSTLLTILTVHFVCGFCICIFIFIMNCSFAFQTSVAEANHQTNLVTGVMACCYLW